MPAPEGGWTLDTLYAYFNELRRTDTLAIQAALAANDKAVQAAMMAADKATTKAEAASEKRFEGVNEFRNTLKDQQVTFVTRAEAAPIKDALATFVTRAEVYSLCTVAIAVGGLIGGLIGHFFK